MSNSRRPLRFTGFALIRLDRCISGDENRPNCNQGNPHFFYRYTEYGKFCDVNVSDITLGTFRVKVGHKKAMMNGDRFFMLTSFGKWVVLDEAGFNKAFAEWEDMATMPDEDYERWKQQ